MAHDPTILPAGLPVPVDDGGCIHLRHAALPDIPLPSTSGDSIRLNQLATPAVLFFYPRTGVPGQPPSLGFQGEVWDTIPGARGCTPQSCGFRDLYSRFEALGIHVFGVSTNTTEHQREFKARTHCPFEFLSDSGLALTRALNLPTFDFPIEGGGPNTLLQRMAWFIEPDSLGVPRIVKVWYPVFPPDKNAATVLAWLERRTAITIRPVDPSDAQFVREELTKHWGGVEIWSLGRMYRGDQLPGFIALVGGERLGLVTYTIQPGGYQCEVITISVRREAAGIASRLLDAAVDAARAARCVRIFLTTTNDNIRAIEFYQRQGWTLAALHKGNVDEARKRKPVIPRIGPSGIAIRDEIECELWLEPPVPGAAEQKS